ncbi:MAG: hypothetical protein AB7U46_12955 [Paenirhodobacter sp.]|uniref:hypothetical protein n=1 Tax=Paenirhodobacter sp. TaxID=1965326 RepID=UPI003D12A4E3
MTEIAELERRISFALERIGRGVEGMLERQALALDAARAEATAAVEAAAEASAEAQAAIEAAQAQAAAAQAEAEAAQAMAQPEAEAQPAPEAAPTPEPAPAASVAPDEIAELREALDAERMANAQLSERVRAIREKQETTLSALEKRLAQATRAFEAVQAEATRLKRANADLVETNRALVEAAGDVPAHLVNRAMQAELEALRAARAWEVTELSDIIAGLEPLVAAHAKEGGDA